MRNRTNKYVVKTFGGLYKKFIILVYCKLFNSHDWNIVTFKDKGFTGRRSCERCGKTQVLMYYKYGDVRYKWKDEDNLL